MKISQTPGGIVYPTPKEKPTRQYGPLEIRGENKRLEAAKHFQALLKLCYGLGNVGGYENAQHKILYHASDMLLGHHDYEVYT